MRKVVSGLCLACALIAALPGCGGTPDSQPAALSDAEKQKKMEEAKAAMEKGMNDSMQNRGSGPPGSQ